MPSISDLTKNGFSLLKRDRTVKDISLLSLRIGLKAYFSTYQAFKHQIAAFDKKYKIGLKEIDHCHNIQYCECYAEAIIHLQHFAELACKEILRAEHPLLAIDAANKPVILHKLLKGQSVNDAVYAQLKTLEFKNTLERLCELIKNKRIGRTNLGFILQSRAALDELNKLRNRIWHRGIYILRYPALDKFIGRHILPFVEKILKLPQYSGKENIWKYKQLNCSVDPLMSILAEFTKNKYNLSKVAFLKELGRAAFENPIRGVKVLGHYDNKMKVRARRSADIECEAANGSEVRKCPVCGVESLVVYDDIEPVDYNPKTGKAESVWRFTYQVRCTCCTFEIDFHLKKSSEYGLPIEDYWYSIKMPS